MTGLTGLCRFPSSRRRRLSPALALSSGACDEHPGRRLLPDMLVDALGHRLRFVGGERRHRQNLKKVVEDENLDFGLRLFFLGPSLQRREQFADT